MPDLQALLDEIDRLDQEATKGPWWGVMDDLTDVVQIFHDQEQKLHVADIGDKTLERVWQDAEFIALARTALPQLAKALRAVLAKCASMERGVGYRVSGQHDTWDSYHEGMSDMAGYIEEAITDALGDDDA